MGLPLRQQLQHRLSRQRGAHHLDLRRLLEDLHLRLEDLRLILADHDLDLSCGARCAHRCKSYPVLYASSLHEPLPGDYVIRESSDIIHTLTFACAYPQGPSDE